MSRTLTFALTSDKAIALDEGTLETWVEIAKVGEWKGYVGDDGKPQTITITPAHFAAAIAAFTRCENDIALDYEHQSTTGAEAPAAGWIDEMRVTGDKLEAHVAFTDRAAKSVRAREYRYTSPVWLLDAPDRVTGETLLAQIPCVALTNVPFQDGLRPVSLSRTNRVRMAREGAASMTPEETSALLDAVMKALGVTDPATLLAAVEQIAVKTDDEEVAPMSVPAAMSRLAKRDVELVAMRSALASAQATIKAAADAAAEAQAVEAERVACAAVDAVIADGKATTAQREHYLSFARSDAKGFAALAATMHAVVPVAKRAGKGEARVASQHDAADPVVAAFRRFGLSDEQITRAIQKTNYVTG